MSDGDAAHAVVSAAILSDDLFFSMRLRGALTGLGMAPVVVKDPAALVAAVAETPPRLVLVDINRPVDWAVLAPVVAAAGTVVAFGPHKDVEAFRAAKAAGVDRVVSNGALANALPGIVERVMAT